MLYRRFGRTEIQMPVLSCGGMRYQRSWQDIKPEDLDAENQKNVKETIDRSLDLGINHIETARGYGSSEYQLGRFLKDYKRDEITVQTKVGPQDSPEKFLEVFETSMNNLQLDYLDLFAFHGVNTDGILDKCLDRNMEAALKLKEQGRIRNIGFSTHGMESTITKACETGQFDYVNVHWYYFDQMNLPSIDAAAKNDMGVFIISPSDKGGMLYEAPPKLIDLCKPFSPIGFNGLFCLANENVHTLSIGASRPSDFNDLYHIVDQVPNAKELVAPVISRLDDEFENVLGKDWVGNWRTNLPECYEIPGEINVYQILRLLGMYETFGFEKFAKWRYNMMNNASDWFPGHSVDKIDWESLEKALADSPVKSDIPAKLKKAHELLAGEAMARLSQS
ncbi:MAG: aldo/keto reductase [Lentisphaeria bacterium]|nr:aldo/keto reductase [Lentisphaeria bacterium]NQZ67106.1 aldo/keto reductase [Lentisphaeria bacterium]